MSNRAFFCLFDFVTKVPIFGNCLIICCFWSCPLCVLTLEITANQISRLINAVELMSTGLDLEDDPHADGFFAVCGYLVQTDQTLRKQVKNCLHAL